MSFEPEDGSRPRSRGECLMAVDPMELVERLEGEPGDCPFCGRDPYHYVDIGVGMERVAVTCCDEGISLFQHGDPVLTEQVSLRREAAACIRVLVEQNRRASAPQAGAFLEAEALAEAWSDRPEIQRMVEVSTGVFAKWASAELLSRFRQQVMGVIQQAYIEGRSEALGGSDA